MINFFKDKKEEKILNNEEYFSKVASLLIHAAKIDETYTDVEKEIIEEPVTIYLNGKPSLVDPKIADTIVNNTDYSYESGSSQLTEDNIQNISQSPTEDFMRTEQQQALELKNMTPRKQKLSDNFAKLLQATVRAE